MDYSSRVGIGTTLARRYSPSLFACGSLRIDAATPSPSRPFDDEVQRQQIRQLVALDLEIARFGESARSARR